MIKHNFNKTKTFNLKAEIMSFLKVVKNISKLEKGKEITIIGTVTKYDFKTKSKAGKLYISDCFAEQ